MYAVIETSGKQFRVAPGDVIRVDTLPGEVGSEVELGRVLAIGGDGSVRAGSDVAEARVKGTILENDRSDKVLVFKFKRKKQYKRTIGHRQHYTAVRVGEIVG